jgi:diguanylate cyclase (GGDEF)-like protein
MNESVTVKPRQSVVLLVGILLTIVAVVAHRFLPERRLSLETSKEGATYFLTKAEDASLATVDWVDAPSLHFKCRFAKDAPGANCGFTYMLSPADAADRGADLSRFRNLNLTIRYTGSAHYLRVAVRNFDPRFSSLADTNSPKFNALNLQPKDLVQPVAINLREFTVPEWWVAQYDLPRSLAQPDLSNATAFSIYLQGEPAGSEHEIQIDKIEFSGDWISAEYWYLGILCAWMLIGVSYGASQWAALRRKHREQRKKIQSLQDEKDKYQKLSTIDGLTKVMNRHGIEQFIESLKAASLPTSVIVIDLDHFKKINDHRGHYDGDRVLQTVGELLKAHTRNTDGLGRWGGEEFVLVCPGASLSKAADLAEKLRQRIMKTNFVPEDPIAVTASFGVATTSADGTFDDAFRQADQALYLAKSRGRNCVVAAGDDQMHKVTGARKGTWALISGRFKLHNKTEGDTSSRSVNGD